MSQNKYLVLIITTCLVLGLILVLLRKDQQSSTISSTPPPASKFDFSPVAVTTHLTNSLNATEKLKQILPFNTPHFSINYRFRDNTFVVTTVNRNQNYIEDFLTWINHTSFRDVPANLFTFSN